MATFPLLVGALSECMACRHLPEGVAAAERDAIEDLWRAAARAFVTVVQTGLPSINICSGQVGIGGGAAVVGAVRESHLTPAALRQSLHLVQVLG